VRSTFNSPPRPSPVLRDLAQISPDLPALPVLPVVQPPDPAACWSLRYHQPQHRLLPTPFRRAEPLDQVPLERLDAGLGDGVASTKRSWRRHCLADVFAHDAVVLRALRGRVSTKSNLRRHGCRLRSLRSPHRSLPLHWLVALLPGSSKRRCNSRQRSRLWKRGRNPEAPGMGCTRRQDLLANRPFPLSLPGTKAKSFKQVLEV